METAAKILLLPPLSLLLLAAAGALLVVFGHRRSGWIAMSMAWLMSLLLATPISADLLIAPLERQQAPLTRVPAGIGAIVVLGAGSREHAPEYGDRFRPDYIALARTEYAAHLARRTGLPLLVSGGGGSGEALGTVLHSESGLPVAMWELDSRTTAENAAHSARVLHQRGIGSILLVTDAMHMPRALASFAGCGLQVTPAPTMFLATDFRGGPTAYDFVPSAQTLRAASYALYEWMGLAWYRLRPSTCGTGNMSGSD